MVENDIIIITVLRIIQGMKINSNDNGEMTESGWIEQGCNSGSIVCHFTTTNKKSSNLPESLESTAFDKIYVMRLRKKYLIFSNPLDVSLNL